MRTGSQIPKPNTDVQDLPDGYRMTELGPLPEEWQVVRLGEVAEVRYGKAKPKSVGTVPVIGSGGTYGWTDKPLIGFPSLIIGRKGTAGQVWLAQEPCWPSDTTFYLEWKQDVDVSFLHGYFLLNPLSGEHAKTTLPTLQRPDLENYLIPLPPLPEQRAIAHVLRTVQRAKEAGERVVAALKELKKSLMRHLFTYGPVAVGEQDAVPLRDTEIGPIPAHWQVVRLGEVVRLRKGTVLPADVPNTRYVGLEHIDSGEIKIRQFGYAAETKSAKAIFQQGDILYGKLRPYLDKAALAEWEGVCSTDILVLIPKRVDSMFAAYLMHSSYVFQHAIATTTGVNHPRTSWKALAQGLIPLPPLSEQREIARILQAVDRRIEAEEAYVRALETLFKSLLHELMTARRRLPKEFVEFIGATRRAAPAEGQTS